MNRTRLAWLLFAQILTLQATAALLNEVLPDANARSEPDSYQEPVLGRFHARADRFPAIESEWFGNAWILTGSAASAYTLYLSAEGQTACATPLGWLQISATSAPLFYSFRHHGWVFIQPLQPGSGQLWIYDFQSGDWFSYTLQSQ